MNKYGVSEENNGILKNSTDKIKFINDVLEQITAHYVDAFPENIDDIKIAVSYNLNIYDISILTKEEINKNDFSDFELGMKMFCKLYGIELRFHYLIK